MGETKKIILIVLLYFFLAWSVTGVYFFTHAEQIPERWEDWHAQIMAGQSDTSNQFRLLAPWLAEAFDGPFNQPIYVAYLMVRFVFTFILFCMFHLFLLKWFRYAGAAFGVVLLAAFTPITFLPYLQESDVVLYPFFLAGVWLIREKKVWWTLPVLFAGTFAKETIAFIIPMYALYQWSKQRVVRTVLETCVLVAVWAGAFYLSRHMFFDGTNSSLWQLTYNISTLKNVLSFNPVTNFFIYFIPLFGVFWIVPFIQLRQKPLFLRRAAPYIVLYTVLNFIMGWPYETRILLPLAFLVIPSGLMTFFPELYGTEKKSEILSV
ncbi:MAG: hypothetical protein WC289_00595 [Patescibacteria group bacterium]